MPRAGRAERVVARLEDRLVRLVPIFAGLGASLTLVVALWGIVSEQELLHAEGWMTWSILQVRDGQPLYSDYRQYPFVTTLYTPLYYGLLGLGARLAQLDDWSVVVAARSLSAAAMLASALLVFAIGRRCGLSRLAAASAAALFPATMVVHPWGYAARVDMLAVALTLAGLWFGLRPAPARSISAGVVLGAAFLTKQSHIAAPAALVLAALHAGRRGQALLVAAGWFAVVGPALLALHADYGHLLAMNLLTSNALPLSPRLALEHLRPVLPLIVALLLLARLGWGDSSGDRRGWGIVVWYTALAGALGLVALAKPGAIVNHVIEATAGLMLLAARGLDRLRQPGHWIGIVHGHRAQLVLRACTCAALLLVLANALTPARALLALREAPDTRELVEALTQAPGDVMTQADTLAVLRAKKRLVWADAYGLSILADLQRWDSGPLNELIERRHFGLVVLLTPEHGTAETDGFAWWPPATQERLHRHYRLVGQIGGRYLYEPKAP